MCAYGYTHTHAPASNRSFLGKVNQTDGKHLPSTSIHLFFQKLCWHHRDETLVAAPCFLSEDFRGHRGVLHYSLLDPSPSWREGQEAAEASVDDHNGHPFELRGQSSLGEI